MDNDQESENQVERFEAAISDESGSVDDFIRQLEEREKDLHITSDTSIIEIAESFDDADDMPASMAEAIAAKKTAAAAPQKAPPGVAVPDAVSLEATITQLKEKVGKLEAEREEMMQNSQRRARDFEALKSRTERERKETFESQVGNLATQMLPALDNLDRALGLAETYAVAESLEFRNFFDGIAIVSDQILEIFRRMGVSKIDTIGELFDPQIHEAVATEENDRFAPNTVSEELLRGYRIGDRILRHSLVKVARPSSDERAREASAEKVETAATSDDYDQLDASDLDK